ncbi:MAG: sugar O-acetyltransferase [Ilumatobacteraceae bacterium]
MTEPVKDEISIPTGTPEFQELYAKIRTAIERCERLNRLAYDDADAIRAAWSELTGQPVDETFSLIPPVRSDHGLNIRVGRKVFINHGCTLNDIGGIDIGDEVMIGPNVSLITSGHPVEPAQRRRRIVAAPIVIGRNVWICAGAMILHGVTVGADSVIAAGAVVTRDVPAATLVAGVPARVIREL